MCAISDRVRTGNGKVDWARYALFVLVSGPPIHALEKVSEELVCVMVDLWAVFGPVDAGEGVTDGVQLGDLSVNRVLLCIVPSSEVREGIP